MSETSPINWCNSTFKINGGIGLISSRFTLDLPIKNKGGFLISGRRSYIDRIFKLVNSDEEISLPFFYDFNLNFNYKLKKDKVVFNFYNGNDAIIALPNSINFRNTASSIVYNKYLNDKSGIDDNQAKPSVRLGKVSACRKVIDVKLIREHVAPSVKQDADQEWE